MRFICARQAWHDAFMTDLAAPDFATQAAGVGVQFSARGADNKIVDHCERALIQQAIAILRERDVVAHAWGMIAYAPQGVATMGDFSVMFGHLRTAFFSRLPLDSELLKLRHNPEYSRLPMQQKCVMNRKLAALRVFKLELFEELRFLI
jgi:hypothetical protein